MKHVDYHEMLRRQKEADILDEFERFVRFVKTQSTTFTNEIRKSGLEHTHLMTNAAHMLNCACDVDQWVRTGDLPPSFRKSE